MPRPLPDIMPVQVALQALIPQQVRWREGGLDPATGLGCYGLLVYAFAVVGIVLPTTAEAGQHAFTRIPPPYQPFDVMLARLGPEPSARHVGLFVAPTWGFHCSWLSNGVAHFSLDHGPWRRWLRHGLRLKEWCACA